MSLLLLTLSAALATEPVPLGGVVTLTPEAEGRATYGRLQNEDFGALPSDPNGAATFRAILGPSSASVSTRRSSST